MNNPCEVHEHDLRRYRAERDAAVHEREALKAHLLVEREKAARLERERDALAAQLAALHAQVHEVVRHRDAVPALEDAERRARATRGGCPDEGWGDDAPPSWQAWRDARQRLDEAKRAIMVGVGAFSLADTAPAAEAYTKCVQAEECERAIGIVAARKTNEIVRGEQAAAMAVGGKRPLRVLVSECVAGTLADIEHELRARAAKLRGER